MGLNRTESRFSVDGDAKDILKLTRFCAVEFIILSTDNNRNCNCAAPNFNRLTCGRIINDLQGCPKLSYVLTRFDCMKSCVCKTNKH